MGSAGLFGAFGSGGDVEFREVTLPLLFDNCIGRKRDVGGGFLAGTCRGSGLWRELKFGFAMGTEEMLTVTFQNSSRLSDEHCRNVVRRSGFVFA